MVVKWPLIPIIDQGPHFQALPIFNTMQTDSQKEAKVKQAGKNKSKRPREKKKLERQSPKGSKILASAYVSN